MASIEERTDKKGKKTYRVKVRLRGYPPQSQTFIRKTDANAWAAKIETQVREGQAFPSHEAKKHTLAETIDRYIQDELPYKKRNKDQKPLKAKLQWWKKEIGHYRLSDVTAPIITDCKQKLRRGKTYRGTMRGPSTVNRYLAAISVVLKWAVKEKHWLTDSPMRGVSRMSEPKGRERFLSDDERDRLLNVCKADKNPHLYPVVMLALSTGMRYSEIMGLTWDSVNLKTSTIRLIDTKNDESRNIPIVATCKKVIEGLSKVRRLDTKLLFPAPTDPQKPAYMRFIWENAVKEAEIEDFVFHDLRHSAGSYLAMSGANPSEIAAILGHKTLSMVKRYAHIADEHSANVLERMNNGIFGGGH